jgi:tRNA pseudouridine55 synthase
VVSCLPPPRSGQRQRVPKRAVHGVLLLDKPLGLSSNDALQRAKRLYRAEKAGHTGTLDPLATGLLPLCFGAATKFSQVSLDADKRYRATLQLGVVTSTGDAEGECVQRREVNVTALAIAQACHHLTGAVVQIPPMHSALKYEGRPLYEYARAGIELKREPRHIMVHELKMLAWAQDQLVLDIHCSKGTYIRTLAQDLGEHLGCGAHLSALQRTHSGPLGLASSCTLEQLQAATELERDQWLLSTDTLLADVPLIRLEAGQAGRFLSGVRQRLPLSDAPQVRVYGPQEQAFLGSAHITAGELIATRLLSPVEVQGLLSQEQSASSLPPFLF